MLKERQVNIKRDLQILINKINRENKLWKDIWKLHSYMQYRKQLKNSVSYHLRCLKYSENIRSYLEQESEVMIVPIRNGHLYTLRFADDHVIVAQDEEDLSFMLRKLKEYERNELEINLKQNNCQ